MIRTFFVAGAAIALAACTTVSAPGPSEVGAGDISLKTMQTAVKSLASDEFEGRGVGTVGEEKTVSYLIEQFRQAGLQPGNKGHWVQEVPLVEITGSNFAPLTITGGQQALSFKDGSDWVGVSYREAAKTRIEDSELVFVGYGINAPEKGWNDYAGIDMKGKTAVILVNDPDYETQGLEGEFNGRAMTFYGRWTYKFEEAARQGATAAIIVHDEFPAAYGWNVVESSWTGPQAYAQSADGGAIQTAMNGWVQKPVAEKILASAGQDLGALSAAAKRKGFKAVPLGLKLSTSFDNAVRKFQSQNVIAMLPGSERPDEYVLYTAHWDHLGRCGANAAGDDICNGAIDNATGTAALVALGEAHAKAGAPARSLVFLAVTAEESGLLGSAYYAANPVFPLDQTVGGVNMDALSMAGPAKDVTVVGGGKSMLDGYLDRALVALGRTATPEPTPEKGYYYRSDHFSFAKRGVPMLYIDGGEDLIDGGKAAGAAFAKEYTEKDYHQPSDAYREAWHWNGVMADLQLYYRLGRMLAMSDEWPNWVEGDEFKAARDASCAASAKGC
ncbi:M28 family metallopeptidase [Parerythrobacter lacustris]|uniref:M28 family metallopeptidase n=1 Tax=Parerythrobacter lacustris TaxID=2969984 RepID=A0ABT1XL96_9SPHN|nr:M28 family metallopeptidase [Parerythrobacter lacustris]MCR2832438.1 M28 family metallopeptidase [Parerythrobacter lacustris]